MPISLQSPNSDDDTATQLGVLSAAQAALEDQINGTAQYAGASGRIPFGRPSGSLAGRAVPNGIALSISAGGKQTSEKVLSDEATDLLAVSFSDADPTTDDFPNDGDWGWHFNTTSSIFSFARNYQGTIYYPNPGGAVSFVGISGSISDAQHGTRAGGTLHANATTSVAGFMSSTDKVKLNNYPPDCTDTTSSGDDNAVLRASGFVRAHNFVANSAGSYFVGTNQVVEARKTGYTNFSNISFLRDISDVDFVGGAPIFADGSVTVGGVATTNFRALCRFVAVIAHDIGVNGHGLLDCN